MLDQEKMLLLFKDIVSFISTKLLALLNQIRKILAIEGYRKRIPHTRDIGT